MLRKYDSNEKNILDTISKNASCTDNLIKINNSKKLKTLGLVWNSTTDTLQYFINVKYETNKITKRTILSVISQIFDPLGLIEPAIINAKIIMQQLWNLQTGWDEPIPIKFLQSWINFVKQLQILNDINIPRQVTCTNSTHIEMHCFCDSSEKAYGAAIYVKSTNISGDIYTRLLCAKSRVTPLKPTTLPILELLAAVLLAKLSNKVRLALDIPVVQWSYYSDSTIVLSWISTHPSRLKIFVANRVVQITELTNIDNWYHVKSEDNPADVISRGINSQDLASLDM